VQHSLWYDAPSKLPVNGLVTEELPVYGLVTEELSVQSLTYIYEVTRYHVHLSVPLNDCWGLGCRPTSK
jgi:hypothetical protein